jgi:PAS domain S-box-containing protein
MILEDSTADFGLVLHEVKQAGLAATCERASGHDEFTALLGQSFDIILADYRLPDFTALDALCELRKRHIDTPMIIVTAALGDEEAAHCIRMGAADYLLKDRLHRLGPAIERSLDERRQRLEREAALRRSEQRFRDMAEIAGDIIWETDREYRFTFIQGGDGALAGTAFAVMLGTAVWALHEAPANPRDEWERHAAALVAQLPFRRIRRTMRGTLGRQYHFSISGTPFCDADGRFAGYRGAMTDETESVELLERACLSEQQARQLAAELAEQHELLRVTLRSIGDGVITTDGEGKVVWLNPVAERLTGWPVQEALGRPLPEVFRIVNETTREPRDNPVATCLAQGRVIGLANHTVLISREGDEFGIEDSAAPIRTERGEILGVVLVFHDVTEQRQLSGEMSCRASHDTLTGLINRSEFEVRLRFLLHKAHADRSQNAMLFIDLDQFKLVNDTWPVDHRWPNTAAVMQAADGSCYAAKEAGRNQVHVWFDTDKAMRARHGETQLATRLAQALDENRFVLFAQRIRALKVPAPHWFSDPAAGCGSAGGQAGNPAADAEVTDHDGMHAEVLLRMLESDGSLASPAAFLPAAERFHMGPRIDRWVLTSAISWMSTAPALARIKTLYVNLSGQSVGDRGFHRWAIEMLSKAGPAVRQRLCLEITETAAVTNLVDAATFIEQVRAIGVRVALDDFGAGASSFGYLKTMPVDFLKIDGQFIRDLMADSLDEAAVRCFADVAAVVGMLTIAEFVDDPEVLRKLCQMGIDFAQGYLIHRPAPIEELLLAA